jgi:hypothetical protein
MVSFILDCCHACSLSYLRLKLCFSRELTLLVCERDRAMSGLVRIGERINVTHAVSQADITVKVGVLSVWWTGITLNRQLPF